MKILAIVGSLRTGSFNRQMAEMAKEILKDKAEIEVLDYKDVPLFNEDIEFPAPESIKRVREKVAEADGIWFFTPEYNHSFSGVLKNLIDWLSRPIEGSKTPLLAGKPVAISGASYGMTGTAISQDYLVSLISFLNMKVMNAPRLTVPSVMSQVDENGKLTLKDSYKYLERQAEAFVKFVDEK